MIPTPKNHMRADWSAWKLATAVRGAHLALRIPVVKDYLIHRVLQRLGNAYNQLDFDADQSAHLRWLGQHLEPFLQRLLRERPSAARAILRFLGAWVRDMYRREQDNRVGKATPCTVVIEPTDRCNLFCPGCYAKSSADGSDLPFEHMAQIVEQVVDMGVTLITFSGGEPFLREKADRALTRLGERFSERGFLVYTNGMLIDEAIAADLGRVGNVFPAISVEGFERQTDRRRGPGVYEKDRRVRALLARHEVMFGFSATVTSENCESICADAFIDRRLEEGDLFGWFFLLQPIGRAPRPDLMPTADQRAMLRDTVHRWRGEARPIFLGDFWNDGHYTGGCIAGGRHYFHIYANGDLSPCVFCPVSCGNIFDIIAGRGPYSSLDDFVQRNPVFRAYRDEQDRIDDRDRPCLLIDHPEAFRRINRVPGCRPAKNFPPGYLDGQIAQTIDQTAARWRVAAATRPPLEAPAASARAAQAR